MCIQKDSWAGESDFVRKMIRMSVERIVAMRRPCLRFEMARSLLAAVFFAEAFAIVAGEGEGDVAIVGNHQRSCLPPHTNHTLVWLLLTLPQTNSLFFPHRQFEVQARHATRKHAQLRTSLKVRRKVTHPLLPHTRAISCGCPSGLVAFRSQPASCLIPRLIYLRRLYFTTFPGPLPKPQHLNTCSSEFKPPPIRDTGHGASGSRAEPTSEADSQASYYYFTLDDDLFYLSFYQDWGPLNMAMVYRACILIHELLEASAPFAFRLFVGAQSWRSWRRIRN